MNREIIEAINKRTEELLVHLKLERLFSDAVVIGLEDHLNLIDRIMAGMTLSDEDRTYIESLVNPPVHTGEFPKEIPEHRWHLEVDELRDYDKEEWNTRGLRLDNITRMTEDESGYLTIHYRADNGLIGQFVTTDV